MHLNHKFSVAPMLNWTDRHCRYFLRLLSHRAILYTEMVTTGAILHGRADRRLLTFSQEEHPIALQLGGSDPTELAQCARIAEAYGYDEINLNVGCPSDRVQSGHFGACLMAEPERVARGVAAMKAAVSKPVISVKTRIGIDEQDSYEELVHFIGTVANAGCDLFIIHARKAWLQGLSPKENREIPPLRYDVVRQIKQDFPHLNIVINGGITDMEAAQAHLKFVDGVMLGRVIYHEPYLLTDVDSLFYGEVKALRKHNPYFCSESCLSAASLASEKSKDYVFAESNGEIKNKPTRHEIIDRLIPYIEQQLLEGVLLSHITRHILGLFHGQPGARGWRRYLTEEAHKPGADCAVLLAAMEHVR
jgi:tRNA-dihydrouridine synthase A